jgi:hypothetical protein
MQSVLGQEFQVLLGQGELLISFVSLVTFKEFVLFLRHVNVMYNDTNQYSMISSFKAVDIVKMGNTRRVND